ncbi:MAG: invasin domain 3-containing protein [Gemmatimonadota bacterium]
MRPVHHRLLRQAAFLTLAITVVACSDTDNLTRPSVQGLYTTPTGLVTANPPQIFIGAGDISSCSNNGDEMTAQIIDTIPGTVYNLGDDAYDNGTTSEFNNCYNPTWGRFKSRTKPSAGNHEYNTSGATGYYAYFGAAAGDPSKGYYSYDLGLWHIIVLNSNISRSVGSAQDTWLKSDLDAHPGQCTLAYWHHPLYSSTGGTGSGGVSISSMKPFWDRLYAAHADLVLNGHRHFYERLKPMKPDGSYDPTNGITEIIAGSGGIGGGTETNLFPTHITGNGDTRGVLKLYLYDDSFAWRFIPIAGKTYTDTGSTACHISGGGGGGGGTGVSATNSTVTASPTSFTAGSGSSTITVTAKDGNGATISGASVTVTASGSGNTLTPASGTTNGSGVFTSTFTSSVAETKTISANINGTAINQTASVTVNPSGGGGGGGGNGTIAHSLLTAGGNGANQSVYATASIAPAANALVTVAVRMRRSTGPLTPAISGGGMTSWTLVTTLDYGTIATPDSRLSVFRAMSTSPGSGPINITFSGSISNADWSVSQWTGVDQSGTNGSGAIGQIGSAAGDATTSLSKALAAFASPSNVALGVVAAKLAPPAVTPGSGFTEITEATSGESTLIESEWGANLNTVSATLSSSTAAGLVAIELIAGSSGPSVSASNSTVAASPTSITAGGSGSTITVTAKDGSGNPISGATVVLAATGSGNTLTQPASTTNASGVATGTLASTVAEAKTVSATINGTAITQQATVTVNPAAAAALAYTTQPSNTQANAPITPAVAVEIRDAFGNHVNSSATVAMAIGTNPGSGTLGGTTSKAASNGVATFSDLAINNTGTGYTLVASSTGLTNATSAAFNITAPAPSAALSTVVAGTPSFTAGGSSAITVTVVDGLGNPLSGVTVTLSSSVVGDAVTQPAATTDGSGVASGSVGATSAGSRTITATASGITLNQKPTLTVSAGSPNAGTSTVAASPTSITAGSGTSTITVTARDQYGNPVSGSTVVVGATGSGNTITGPSGPTGSNGVATATFSSSVAEGKTISASATGVAITQTASVTVTNQPPPGITQTLLTSGHDPTNASLFTTASIAPAPNALVTVAVLTHQASAAAPSPTLTGGGMSAWTVVASVAYNGATPLDRLTIFRAMSASPGSGPITITSSVTVSNCQWIVSQWNGVDQSGTNGSGAIAQTASASGSAVTSLTAALAAFASPSNVAYGAFGAASATSVIVAGSGFTTIDQQPSGEGTVGDLFAEWAVNLPAVTASWSSRNAGALGVEIKAAP